MRVLVMGNSGSGKSWYAKGLAAREGLAHLDLDTIVWAPGEIAVARPQAEVLADLRAFVHAHPAWVAEGCYGDLVEAALPWCTQLVLMNPGAEVCLANNGRRAWEPHKYESKEKQDSMLPMLRGWVESYYTRTDSCSLSFHRRVFDGFDGAKSELLSL